MADEPTPIRKAALSDSSVGFRAPELAYGMRFRDYGSYGLRQYSGWVREEFLQELIGQVGARAYREMMDNSSVVGSMLFAIMQAMRKVEWRVDPADVRAPELAYGMRFRDYGSYGLRQYSLGP